MYERGISIRSRDYFHLTNSFLQLFYNSILRKMFAEKYYRIINRLYLTIRTEFDDFKVIVEIFDMSIIVFMLYELHSLHDIKATLIALQALLEFMSITETSSKIIEMVCSLKTVLTKCPHADV
jgi:hypothetical protein